MSSFQYHACEVSGNAAEGGRATMEGGTLAVVRLLLSVCLPFAAFADALTPSDDLFAAVADASAGATIELGAGTFALTNSLVIDKGITLKGAGADKTILSCSEKGEYIGLQIADKDAVVEGVAFTGVYFKTKPATTPAGGTYNAGVHQDYHPLCVYITAGTLRDSTITNNYATMQYGYGVYAYLNGADAVMDNVKILDNYYNRTGNGVSGYALRIRNGTVRNSEIAGNGCRGECSGAIYMDAGKLVDSLIHDNDGQAANYHGGIYMGGANAIVERCKIYNNNNGVCLANGTLVNSLIYNNGKSGNEGYYAGVRQSNGKLYYCTIYGNVSQNDATGISDLYKTAGTATSNLVGDQLGRPAFTDAANGDYTLTLSSVAIGAGTPISGYTTDFLGVTRSATAPSAGAYEYVAGSSLACGIKITTDVFKEGSAATVAAVTENAENPTYEWYVDGDKSSETSATPSFANLAAGRHTVKLVVKDGDKTPVEYPITDAFTIKPTVVYVATDTTPVFPYNTANGAANTIEDALGAVYSDAETVGRVNVAAGTYRPSATILLADPVEVVGAGRDATIISGGAHANAGRGVYMGNAKSSLKDLTITGCTNMCHGVGVYMKNGTLDNVHVTRSYQSGSGDGYNHGAGVLMESGVITNSLVDYNYLNANYHGSQGIGVWMSGGLLTDSEIANNWMTRNQHNGMGVYVKGGTVRRCSIHGNYSTVNSSGGSGTGNCASGLGMNISGSNTLVEDCTICSNGWNGVMITGGTIRNSLIFGHRDGTKDYFAGVNCAGGKVINCTITDNYAAGDSDGKSGLWMTSGTAVNNIIYNNGQSSLGSTCVTGGTFATNILDKVSASYPDNIVSDPKFADASAGDFRIQNGSPAIDAADSSVTGLPDHDLDGIVRPQRKGYDIGCYELEPSTEKTVAITATQTDYPGGAAITAVAVTENIDEETATFNWTLKAGDEIVYSWSGVGTGYMNFSYDSAPYGASTLTLSVTDGDKTIGSPEGVTYSVKPTVVYVSTDGGNISPYNTREKAARSVNDAVAAAWQSGDVTTVVHIASGEYRLNASILLATPVRLLGGGRDITILNGHDIGSAARALTMTHDDAYVTQLTFDGCTNAVNDSGSCVRMEKGTLDTVRITRDCINMPSSDHPHGGGLWMNGGFATNCVIDHCGTLTQYGDAQGLGLMISGGVFTDGRLIDNYRDKNEHHGMNLYLSGNGTVRRTYITGCKGSKVYGDDTYGGSVYISGGTVEDCEIRGYGVGNGVWMAGGTLRNSLVTGFKETTAKGTASAGGLYACGGTVVNCTIAGNTNTLDATACDVYQSSGSIYNSIAQSVNKVSGTEDANIFNQDAKFRNPAKGDYRPRVGSPAIDTADTNHWNGAGLPTALDLGGNRRFVGGKLDCGCYEHRQAGMAIFVR